MQVHDTPLFFIMFRCFRINRFISGLQVIVWLTAVVVFLMMSGRAYAMPDVIIYDTSIQQDEDEGKLLMPSFVTTDRQTGEIYVIDSRGRIILYTSDGFPLMTLGKRYGIEAPVGLALDREGTLYVAQAASKSRPRPRISVFSPCLKWERDLYAAGFENAEAFSPRRLAFDRHNYLYVAGNYFPGVPVLSEDGVIVDFMTAEEEGRPVKFMNVTIDDSGRIFLVSEDEGAVYVYDENRKFLFRFGEKGGSSGKLSRPRAVGIDERSGNMFVADYMRHTISAYGKTGQYLFEFGGLGWGAGWFQHPNDLDVDTTGRILVADFFNQRIQIFRLRQ